MAERRISISMSNGEIRDPGDTKVKMNEDTVRWELDGEGELRITFTESPFGEAPGRQPTSEGRVCKVGQPPREGSANPPSKGHEGRLYKYAIEVTRGGRRTKLDPNVEVIP